MTRINISVDLRLLEKFDKICDELRISRSAKISEMIRKEVFKENVYPGIAKAEEQVSREIPPSKPRVSEDKIQRVMRAVSEGAKAPMFCKKHNGSRIGDHYTCGCKV